MKAEKKNRQTRYSALDLKRLELEELRKKILSHSTQEELNEIQKKEVEIRDIERKEAINWRRKSRVRWLSLAEAPTKYFYVQLKAKQIRDTIVMLEDQNGEQVTSDKGLVKTVQASFEEWFRADPELRGNQEMREEALELLTEELSEEANAILSEKPEDDEIQRVIWNMKKEKAPGIDGVTSEMLVGCWEFLGEDCCAIVQEF
jgi:hypothetical protein